MKIALSNIEKNPHRNMTRNPIQPHQIKILTDSFKRNEIWPNIVVRHHPTKKDTFELAYGHHRLDAMRKFTYTEEHQPPAGMAVDTNGRIISAEFIVEDITDWGMYTAMVDENEAQRTITPELIYENVEAGIAYLEPIVNKCATTKEFISAVEISTADFGESQYAATRNNLLSGQGLGVGFLSKVLPGDKSTDRKNIQTVVDSHYGTMKEKAKTAKAKAKTKAASAKRKAAEAAEDSAAADKLNAEAEQHDREASALEAEAKRLSASASQEVLLLFKNAAQMSGFAGAVKKEGVPKSRHMELAQKLISDGTGSQNYRKEINKWWDIESGAQAKRFSKAKRETDIKKLAKKFGGADINSVVSKFLRATLADWKDLYTVKESVQYLKPKTSDSLHEKLSTMYDELGDLLNALENKPDNVKPITPSEVKRLTQN